jgi:hypothetical protein
VRQDLRAPHEFGAVLSLALRTYGRHFTPLFLLALITAPLQMLIIVVTRRIESDETAQAVAVLLQVPQLFVTLAAFAALVAAINDIATSNISDASRAIDAALPRVPAALSTALLELALLLASLASWPFLAIWWLMRREATVDGRRDWWLVLIPFALTVYLTVRWALHVQAVMIEQKSNWAALDASAEAVRGHWWRAFGVLFVSGALAGLVSSMTVATAEAAPIVEAVVTAGVGALVLPFVVGAQTILYYDLQARRFTSADID